MSKDTVKLFQQARAALQSEKASLSKALADAKATAADAEKRLAEIEAALGGAGTAPAKRRGRPAKKTTGKRRGRPAKKKAAAKQEAVKKAAKTVVKKAAKKAPKKAARKAPAKKAKNKLSLKQVALKVTKGKTLDAKQILAAAENAGHKFSGKNPLNSLRVMLYTNKKAFKQPSKGKFTAA